LHVSEVLSPVLRSTRSLRGLASVPVPRRTSHRIEVRTVAKPKYKVGDVVRTQNGKTYTINRVDPSKPKNCYGITGKQGGRYICGDKDIVGLASEVSKDEARKKGNEDRFDLEEGRRHARLQAKVDTKYAAQWEKVATLNPGDPVRMGRRTFHFLGVKVKAPVTPIIAASESGTAYRFPIWQVEVEGALPESRLTLTAAPGDPLFTEAVSIVEAMNTTHDGWLEGTGDHDGPQDEKSRWERLNAIDDELRPQGLVPGRLVRWPALDGLATYLVLDVGPEVCQVMVVKYMDGYTSPAVTPSGKAFTEAVRQAVEHSDALKRLRNK